MSRSLGARWADKIKLNLLHGIFTLLRMTWKVEIDELPAPVLRQRLEGKNFIIAHFHEDEWALLSHFAHTQMHALVSQSQDGDLMTAFLERISFRIARGSSTRGGASGFLRLMRNLKRSPGAAVSMAIDGPRGPRRKAKPGILRLSAALDAPIVATSAYANRAWVFSRSWSRAFVPKPFAKVRIVMLPFELSRELKKSKKDEDLAEGLSGLEDEMLNAKSLAMKSSF